MLALLGALVCLFRGHVPGSPVRYGGACYTWCARCGDVIWLR